MKPAESTRLWQRVAEVYARCLRESPAAINASSLKELVSGKGKILGKINNGVDHPEQNERESENQEKTVEIVSPDLCLYANVGH